jgi:hypothetical protein
MSFPSILVEEEVETLPSKIHSSPMDVVKWLVSGLEGFVPRLLSKMPMIISATGNWKG